MDPDSWFQSCRPKDLTNQFFEHGSDMKIAIFQMNPLIAGFEKNYKNILALWEKSKKLSPDLVVIPEMGLWGYPARDLLSQKSLVKKETEVRAKLISFAQSQKIAVLIGHPEENTGNGKSYFNCATLYSGDYRENSHRPLHHTGR